LHWSPAEILKWTNLVKIRVFKDPVIPLVKIYLENKNAVCVFLYCVSSTIWAIFPSIGLGSPLALVGTGSARRTRRTMPDLQSTSF